MSSLSQEVEAANVAATATAAAAALGTIYILRKHLTRESKIPKCVQKCPKVSESVQKGLKVSNSVQQCLKGSKGFKRVFKSVQKCPKVSKSVQKCLIASKSVQKTLILSTMVKKGQSMSKTVHKCPTNVQKYAYVIYGWPHRRYKWRREPGRARRKGHQPEGRGSPWRLCPPCQKRWNASQETLSSRTKRNEKLCAGKSFWHFYYIYLHHKAKPSGFLIGEADWKFESWQKWWNASQTTISSWMQRNEKLVSTSFFTTYSLVFLLHSATHRLDCQVCIKLDILLSIKWNGITSPDILMLLGKNSMVLSTTV